MQHMDKVVIELLWRAVVVQPLVSALRLAPELGAHDAARRRLAREPEPAIIFNIALTQ